MLGLLLGSGGLCGGGKRCAAQVVGADSGATGCRVGPSAGTTTVGVQQLETQETVGPTVKVVVAEAVEVLVALATVADLADVDALEGLVGSAAVEAANRRPRAAGRGTGGRRRR